MFLAATRQEHAFQGNLGGSSVCFWSILREANSRHRCSSVFKDIPRWLLRNGCSLLLSQPSACSERPILQIKSFNRRKSASRNFRPIRILGRAVAQAVSLRLPRVRTRVRSCGICGEQKRHWGRFPPIHPPIVPHLNTRAKELSRVPESHVSCRLLFRATNIQFTRSVLTAGHLKATLTQRNIEWIQLKDFW
jgi:hypothetical protein